MNAYELADELANYYKDISDEFDGFGYIQESATMLRQQADQLDKVIPQLVKANGLIENLRIRIAELEKCLKELVKQSWHPRFINCEYDSDEKEENKLRAKVLDLIKEIIE